MTERFPDILAPALDSSGNPISGAKLNFYITGTSTRKDTYTTGAKSAANTNPVIADSAGRFPDIFMDTDVAYKVVFTDAADVEIWSKDDMVPILPPGTFPIIAVSSKSSNYTVVVADRGADILVDASSGPATITLLPVVTAASGFVVSVIKIDSSTNVVTVDGNLAETINGATTVELGDQYDAFQIGTEGTLWYIKSEKRLPTPAVGNADEIVVVNATGTGYTTTTNPLPPGHLTGMTLSNNATDAVNDIDIAIGKAVDTAGTANIDLTAALGKQLDVSWAAGGTPATPVGGLSSSLTLTNDTTYHAIAGLVAGVADVIFDTSITGANAIADHSMTNIREIGSVLYQTATVRAFTQRGDEVLWDVAVQDYSVTNPGATAVLRALTVPLGKQVEAIHTITGRTTSRNADFAVLVTSPDQADTAPTNDGPHDITVQEAANQPASNSSTRRVRTDTSAQVRTRMSSSTATDRISGTTHGYIDRRGRDG